MAEMSLGIAGGLIFLPLVCLALYRWVERRAPAKSHVRWFVDLLWYLMVGLAVMGAVVAFLVTDRLWYELMRGPCWP